MARHGEFEYSEDDFWANYRQSRDDYYSKIEKIYDDMSDSVNRYVDDIEARLNETYDRIERSLSKYDDWEYDLPENPKRRWFGVAYSKLPRGELMVPAQQTLDDRWLGEEQYFTMEYVEPEEFEDWTKRRRLGWAAFNGVGFGSAAGFMDILMGTTGPGGLIFAGGAGALGAGYGWWETRKRKSEQEDKLEEFGDTRQLSDDQIEQIYKLKEGIGWAGSNIWHRREIYTEQNIADAVSMVGGESTKSSVETMLNWVDDSRSKTATGNVEDGIYADAGGVPESLIKLIAVYRLHGLDDIKDTLRLSPYQSVPLSVQAMIRMDNRRSFMNEFVVEFNSLEDKIKRERELSQELSDTQDAADSIGHSAYFDMKIESLSDSRDEIERDIILQDIKIASLAYAYEHSSAELARYAPDNMEMFESGQLEQWQRGIDELGTLNTDGMSEYFTDILFRTLNDCVSMEHAGRYGSAVREVAVYIRQVAPHVKSEETASEAYRNIRNMLSE